MADSEPELSQSTDYEDSLSSRSIRRYPVTFTHGGSIWRRVLRDVDGALLVDDQARPINLFSPTMKTLFGQRIRFIYNVKEEYRYIVTSDEQEKRFLIDREFGAIIPHKTFTVYYDADATCLSLLHGGRIKRRQGKQSR